MKADIYKVVDGRIHLFCCNSAETISTEALELIVRGGGLQEMLRTGRAVEEIGDDGRRKLRVLTGP